ncbi:MAG TPA: hypothetical protein VER68_03085 [Azonexus sp.]|nr:hypothetical protein [Azonexus sp.]
MSCGTCTLCCKTMKVHELDKAAHVWCQHCQIGKGCEIYETRPESCRIYDCLWLQTQRLDRPMAAELRPDRSRVVVGTTNGGDDVVLYLDPDRPDAWQRPAMQAFIRELRGRRVRILLSRNDVLQPLPN